MGQTERPMNRVGRILGLTGMAIGLLTVASGLGDMAKSKLVGASAVAVLSSGEIAVAVASKQQIQLYSAEGHFLKDVTVDSGRGGIRLNALADGGFQAAAAGDRRLYTFDSNGRVESVRENFDGYESLGSSEQTATRSAAGDVYRIEGSEILREDGASKQVSVVRSAIWPIPGAIFMGAWLSGVGLIIFLVSLIGRIKSVTKNGVQYAWQRGGAKINSIYSTWPSATLGISNAALELRVFSKRWQIPSAKISSLNRVRGIGATGIEIHHSCENVPTAPIFWSGNIRALEKAIAAAGYALTDKTY